MATNTPYPVFAVRLAAALRVKPFTSDDDTRYYLRGVCIEPAAEGALCVSTDGHRLGVFHDRDGFTSETVIVRLPSEIKMPKRGLFARPWLVGVRTSPNAGHISIVDPAPKADDDTPENAMARVEECTLRIGRAFIDGTFPDWRRVIPKPSEKDVIRGFNGEYIKAFGKHMTIRGAAESSPHLVEISGEPDFLGVLMPMRVESKGKLPDWLNAPKTTARKAA